MLKTKSKVVNLTVHEVYKTVIRDHPTASNEWICHELDCLWKTHPILNSIILGHDTGRFLENSSKIEHLVEKLNSKNSGAWHRPIFYKKNGIGTHKKWRINFPEIGPAHAPEIEISKKYSIRKLKFRENFWVSYPGFAYKG